MEPDLGVAQQVADADKGEQQEPKIVRSDLVAVDFHSPVTLAAVRS